MKKRNRAPALSVIRSGLLEARSFRESQSPEGRSGSGRPQEEAALDRLWEGHSVRVNPMRPALAGPELRRQFHPIRLSLCSQSLLEKLPRSATLHQSNPDSPDSRNPVERRNRLMNQGISTDLNHLAPASRAGKKRTLCCNEQTVERMEENFNTGSRKHDVSNSASLSQPACCSRGQVQREFINSFMSVANYGPLAQEKKVLCYQSRWIRFQPSAGCVAPQGVAL